MESPGELLMKAFWNFQNNRMPNIAEPRDVDLIRLLAKGDESAFLEFYRRHQGAVFRFALYMTGRPEAAADIVQETFLTLMSHARNFDESKGAPVAFLFGMARNHLKKLREKEGRYVAWADSAAADNGERGSVGGGQNGDASRHEYQPASGEPESALEALEREEAVELLRRAVGTLPEHYREPLTLCDLQGKSYEEVAELLSCPVGTVRSRLNRARSILLEKLRPAAAPDRALRARQGGKP